jgi:hypothetical protein
VSELQNNVVPTINAVILPAIPVFWQVIFCHNPALKAACDKKATA